MRNPFKRRPTAKPTLREGASTLKSGLARLLTRPEGQGEANPHRRALVAGSVAAAIPLPVLARAASPTPTTAEAIPLALPALVTGPHPDRALLDLGAALERAIEAEGRARQAADAAWEPVRAVLMRRPEELVPSALDCSFTGWPRNIPGFGIGQMHWIPGADHPTDHWRWGHALTAELLRMLIAHAVPLLGQGGQTPHRIRHWRELLPIAEAFDAEVAAARAATDHDRLADEAKAAEALVRNLRHDIHDATATTSEGLAVHVRTLFTPEWGTKNDTHSALFRSAAAVAGVPLPVSDFDPAAWTAAWEQAGGTIKKIPQRHGRVELAFIWPRASDVGPEKTAALQRLSKQQQSLDGIELHRWLRANR